MKLIKNKKGHHEFIILSIISGISGFMFLRLKRLKKKRGVKKWN